MRRASLATVAFGLFLVLLASPARAEQATSLDRCVSAIAGDVLRFVAKAGKCVQKCEDAKRRGDLAADVRCRRPSNNLPTQSCLLASLELLAGSKSNALKRCADDEVALLYAGSDTCPGKNDNLPDLLDCLAARGEKAVQGLAKKIYHPQKPPVCGDGILSPGESCDPYAVPNGCGFGQLCQPQSCYCTFQGCGNGIIEAGEDCDYNAYPSGCSYGAYCDYGCQCRTYSSPSAAFLCESHDLFE